MHFRFLFPVALVLTGLSAWAVPPMRWASLMLMQQAAEAGDPDAEFLIGLQYQVGDGVDKNPDIAALWFRLAAETGHAEAQQALGSLLAARPDDPAHAEAAQWLQTAAEQGNVAAQVDLGNLYAQGNGVTPDTAQALRWYLQAAGNGSVDAIKALGNLYARGQGVTPDPAQALKWFQQAAALGDVEARFILERMEVVREAVTADAEHNLKSWQDEAATGDLGSMLALGLMAGKTADMDEDPAVTVRWSLLLSGLRGADAWLVRGLMLENGIAVNTDFAAAAASYLKAAELGDARGQYRLGLMLAAGRGVPADPVEAVVWLTLATANGADEAALPLAELKATLTDAQSETVSARVRTKLGAPAPEPDEAAPANPTAPDPAPPAN